MDAQQSADVNKQTAPEAKSGDAKSTSRTLLAVGDLHGDYFRLLRHLRDLDLLLPDTLAWNPAASRTDVVLIGDYVDWRGESLESPTDQSPIDNVSGARRIIELLLVLEQELTTLRKTVPGFDSHLYPLLGNHDEMMLESLSVFEFLSVADLQTHLNKSKSFPAIKRSMSDAGLTPSQIETVLRFLNWYVQGGESTMRGFGGMQAWKDAMAGELGTFLKERLYLAVIVNHRLFAHTVPDKNEFWRPLDELAALPPTEYAEARESFMWSRKIWGFDYYTGMRTAPFTERELDDMLTRLECKSTVIGHTPIARGTDPIVAYGGKVINIDVHGAPGAKALIENYEPTENSTKAPLRSQMCPQSSSEWLA